MTWNIEGANAQIDILILLISIFESDLLFLEECHIRISEVFDFTNQIEDYNFHYILPEEIEKKFEDRLAMQTNPAKWGL